MSTTIINGDSFKELKKIESNSIHNCITDPPWCINFMSKDWDNIPNYQNWTQKWATEIYRILKPGGFLLCLCGTRTYHRLLSGIEDAGFEIKDTMTYIFASGFPKSHKIINKIDKMMGEESKVVGKKKQKRVMGELYNQDGRDQEKFKEWINKDISITEPTSEEAKKYEGWQTPQLKPAVTFICIAQKKIEKNYAENMMKYQVGCYNIDETRIKGEEINIHHYKDSHCHRPPEDNSPIYKDNTKGRFPANLILDEESRKLLDKQSGSVKGWNSQNHSTFNIYGGNSLNESSTKREGKHEGYNDSGGASRFFKNTKEPYIYKDKEYNVDGFINKIKPNSPSNYNDSGGASRFFFCPKASKKEKNYGLEDFVPQPIVGRDENQDKTETPYKLRPKIKKGSRHYQSRCNKCGKKFIGPENTLCKCPGTKDYSTTAYTMKNNHPTIQPMSLIEYLIKLVAYPGTTIIDPFLGSGTTGCAAVNLNKNYTFIGIEKEEEYCKVAKARIKYWKRKQNEQIF